MRVTSGLGGAALAGVLAASGAAAQPAATMRSPLWQGVTRVAIDFALSGAAIATADRLRGAALAATRGRSAWTVSDGPIAEERGTAILTLHYDGAMLHATVRRALTIDDSEGGRVTQAVALTAATDPATFDAIVSDTITAALPAPRRSGARATMIHREN